MVPNSSGTLFPLYSGRIPLDQGERLFPDEKPTDLFVLK